MHILTRSAFFFALFVSISYAEESPTALNLQKIRSVLGKCALRDGPNCFNATLLAKGPTKGMWFVSDAEFKYFVMNSCARVDGSWRYGDVLVQTGENEKSIEHSAVYLGQDKIFEKSAYTGLIGYDRNHNKSPPSYRKTGSSYAIRALKDSRYFKDSKRIQVFRCEQSEPHQQSSDSLAEMKELAKLNSLISEMTFNPEPDLTNLNEAFRIQLPALISFAKSRTGKDPEDMYLFVKLKSFWLNLTIIRFEFRSECERILKNDPEILETALREFKQRILQANPGPQARYILDSK